MNNNQFRIELLNIHWLENIDEEIDLCVHGQVKVRIGNEIIVDNEKEERHWTLSAMAIHLLRTIEKDHHPGNLVGEHLIPCCGHHIDHLKNELDVHIQGCLNGINYWVKHFDSIVELKSESGSEIQITIEDYKEEIKNFVDEVENFYKKSKSKQLPKDEYDKNGYLMFWNEWRRRSPLD